MNKLARLVPLALGFVASLVPCSKAEAQSAGLTLDQDAQLQSANVLLVSGTVPCTYLGQTFSINVYATQGGNGQSFIEGYGDAAVTCSTEYGQQPFTVDVTSYDRKFQKGKAHLFAYSYTCNYYCFRYDAASDVHVTQ